MSPLMIITAISHMVDSTPVVDVEATALGKDCYVKDTKDKGRAVFATRAFQPGEIVYKQAPVASILHPWLCDTHCSGCFQKAAPITNGVLKTCSRCRVARYCSSQCQAMDWKAGHKRECCIIGRLLDAGMTTQQLSGSSLSSSSNPSSPHWSLDCFLAWRVASDAEKFHKAMSMCALSKPSDAIALTAMQFLSILSSCRSKSIPDFDSILGLLVRFPCNNFAIVDDLWSGIGAGVYPTAALFNHSCSPNVIPTFTDGPGKPTLCFRAIRKITPGEEICHSYVELTLPSWKRRDILQRDYEFLCQCERCGAKDGQPRVGSEDWRMVQGAKNRLVLTDPDLCGTADICDDTLTTIQRGDRVLAAAGPFDGVFQQQPSAALRRACDRLYEGELVECESRADFEKLEKAIIQPMEEELSSAHIQLMSASSHFAMTALAIGDFDKALNYIRRVLTIYTEYLPAYHPLIGLQLFTMGDLYNRKGDVIKARAAYDRCKDIISVSHGVHSAIYQTLLDTIPQFATTTP